MSKNRTVSEEFLNNFARLYEAIQELNLPDDNPVVIFSQEMFLYLEEKIAAIERRENFKNNQV